MLKKYVYLLAALTTIAACKTPEIALDNGFKPQATQYSVKGRQGLLIKQKLSFGDFQTTKIKRGWTSSYNIPFFVNFRGAKEQLSFTADKAGQSAEVFCLGKVSIEEINLFGARYSILANKKDVFSAAIVINKIENWDLLLLNPNGLQLGEVSAGRLTHNDETIEIENIRAFEGKNTFLSRLGIYGYALKQNGQTIAAVETMNKGRVWIKNDLSPERRFMIENALAALLLRSNLDDQVNRS